MFNEKRSVVVYGIGDNFIRYNRMIFDNYNVIALVDSSESKTGMIINGHEVQNLSYFNNSNCIANILITPNNFMAIKNSLEKLLNNNCEFISLLDIVDANYLSEKIKVLFISTGSEIDNIINLYYVIRWTKKYASSNNIRVFFSDNCLYSIINNECFSSYLQSITYLNHIDECEFHAYDMIIKLYKYPEVTQFKYQRIAQRYEMLVDYYQACEKYKMMNPRAFLKNLDMSGALVMTEMIYGRTRIQQPDIYGILDIEQDKRNSFVNCKREISIYSDENIFASLSQNTFEQLWNLLSIQYSDFNVRLICKRNDNYKIKSRDGEYISTLEEVQRIVTESALFIGMDSVWVHYKWITESGISLAIFSYSSPFFYGYDRNINFEFSMCKSCCEGLLEYGNMSCINMKEPYACIRDISAKKIYEMVKNNEHKWKIINE